MAITLAFSVVWISLFSLFGWYYGMGAVVHLVVLVMNFVGLYNHRDAEDATILRGGLHHFALVQKRFVALVLLGCGPNGWPPSRPEKPDRGRPPQKQEGCAVGAGHVPEPNGVALPS